MTTRHRLASISAEGEVLVLLRELAGKVDALTVDLAEMRQAMPTRRNTPRACDVRLVRCVAQFVEDRRFSTWELIYHAQMAGSVDMRAALVAAIGDSNNSRKIGRYLKNLEGVDLEGMQIVRDGNENGAARWTVRVLWV